MMQKHIEFAITFAVIGAGLAMTQYVGWVALIPYGVAFVVYLFSGGIVDQRRCQMIPAVAIQAGHGVLIGYGLILIKEIQILPIVGELLVWYLLVLWLLRSPGIWPVAAVSCYQLYVITVVFQTLMQSAPADGGYRGTVLNIVLRISAILLMVLGLTKLYGSKSPHETGDKHDVTKEIEPPESPT